MENMCLNDATLVLEWTKFLTIGFWFVDVRMYITAAYENIAYESWLASQKP